MSKKYWTCEVQGMILTTSALVGNSFWEILISTYCARASPRTTEVFKQHVARAKSESQGARWHLISQAEFLFPRRRAPNLNRGSAEFVVLVPIGDIGVLPADQRRHAQSLHRFASGCKRLRLSEGLAGVCGQ